MTGQLDHFGVPDDLRPWVQVADALLDRIASGEVKPHDQLPAIDALRREAGCSSRLPVTTALLALEKRGVVRRFHGIGYQVAMEDGTPPGDSAVTGAERPALRMVVGAGPEDSVTRRQRFEQAHPEAVILPPAAGRWRAVVAGRTLGAWDLGGLMDEIEVICPPGDTPG